MFPDPQDCSRYVQCVRGRLTTFTCPQGTVFNTQLKACSTKTQSSVCPVQPDQGTKRLNPAIRQVTGSIPKSVKLATSAPQENGHSNTSYNLLSLVAYLKKQGMSDSTLSNLGFPTFKELTRSSGAGVPVDPPPTAPPAPSPPPPPATVGGTPPEPLPKTQIQGKEAPGDATEAELAFYDQLLLYYLSNTAGATPVG